jgi:nitrate/nitrite-specific signal transduction histidine kinase
VDSLQQLSQVTFNYNHNSLTFFFSTLSYLQTDKLSFYYRLKGANPDWIKADASLSVNYSLLPPGSYTFEVYSENGKGYRSKATYFSFTIRPPFWLSWWFITLCCVAVAYTIHFIYKQRINRLLAIQQVRQRVARDLHDDMGSTLSSISILSSMAKDKLDKDPARISEYINKISDNSTRMMEAIDYIVWSINPSNDSMAKVVARMREFATEVLEAKNIDLHFKVDERLEQVKLDMEARRDLFLIYKEAVNNSAKYSNASEVHIELKLTSGRLQLLVSDNGGGFQKGEIKGGGNGLGNMQKRAQSLKGILHIDSEIGKGTTVSLMVPAS